MKSVIILFTLFSVFWSYNLKAQKPYEYETQVNFLQKETQGTMTVRSIGKAKKLKDAVMQAEVNVFDVMLYRGLPETDVSTPLISDESEAKAVNPNYFQQFFDGFGYKKFIMSSVESSPVTKKKGVHSATLDIKVNIKALRKDLENNGIIRKFGF